MRKTNHLALGHWIVESTRVRQRLHTLNHGGSVTVAVQQVHGRALTVKRRRYEAFHLVSLPYQRSVLVLHQPTGGRQPGRKTPGPRVYRRKMLRLQHCFHDNGYIPAPSVRSSAPFRHGEYALVTPSVPIVAGAGLEPATVRGYEPPDLPTDLTRNNLGLTGTTTTGLSPTGDVLCDYTIDLVGKGRLELPPTCFQGR